MEPSKDNHPRKDFDLAIQALGLSDGKGLDLFQKVLDSLPSAISIKLPDHSILISNKMDTLILSRIDPSIGSTIDVRGKRDREIYKIDIGEFEAEENRVLDGETIQHDYTHNNGMLTRVVKEPLYHPDGFIVGIINSSQMMRVPDHEKEIQLRNAQKLEAIGQLAAGIAHEINTPIQYIGDNAVFLRDVSQDVFFVLRELSRCLSAEPTEGTLLKAYTALKSKLEAMDLDYLEAEVPKAIDQSLEGVARVSRIIMAMKEFSQPGSGNKEQVDLNRAIDTTLTVSRGEWKEAADLDLDLEAELPLVPCYPSELNQVILNLLVNATHAIEDARALHEPGWRGRIQVRTRRVENEAEISVSDTGVGIPENILPRIFEPFFTTKVVGKGAGQGLTIVHGVIVEKHGGRIQVDSKVGQGTTFLIGLPLA